MRARKPKVAGPVRVGAKLDVGESIAFLKVKAYVEAMCGHSSNADVLRFLIRDWSDGAED